MTALSNKFAFQIFFGYILTAAEAIVIKFQTQDFAICNIFVKKKLGIGVWIIFVKLSWYQKTENFSDMHVVDDR